MKIIKSGNNKMIKPEVKFACDECGCVFIAGRGEYRLMIPYLGCDWYECKCPECGATVKKDVEY